MRKVLIITDLFYASPRIPGMCKYLSEFGWKATILTTPLGGALRERLVIPSNYANIIEVPFKSGLDFWKKVLGLKRNQSVFAQLEKKFPSTRKSFIEFFLYRLLILGGTLFAYPDEMRGWRLPAIRIGKKLLDHDQFDAIISSSFPVTSHCIAKELKKLSGVPWLADLRDLWTQNHNYLYPKRKLLERLLEKKTLSKANALSTVSDSLLQKLKSSYQNVPMHVIQNGFDPDSVNSPPLAVTKEFTITYTGLTYRNKQNPAKLFAALRELLTENKIDDKKIRVHFYGVTQKWITQLAKDYSLQDIVVQHGPILHEHTLNKQRESQVLLLYGWEDDYETGVLPLKMFEYFAARRPILATGGTPYEQFRGILDKTRAGKYAIEIPDIKTILHDYYCDYLKKGEVSYQGNSEEMDKYTHREMARHFSQSLNTMLPVKDLSKDSLPSSMLSERI